MGSMLYGNTPPFLGAEIANEHSFKDADVLIYGVPWEGAVTWGDYTGCELGPKVMRLCSARYSGYLPELDDIDVFEHLSLADLGDVDVVPANVEETMNRIETFASRIWKTNKFPLALGGDHGITYPIVRALTETTNKKVGIIHLDAHYDNMPHHEGDQYARSTPFARLYELDGVVNESLIHTGIHGPRNKPESGRFAKEAGAKTFTINHIREVPNIRELAESIYELASQNTDIVYLSVCSDVLDFAFNPGGPVDGNGLTSYELLTLIYEFTKRGIIGMDFVEVYPQQDPTDVSSHFASTIALYALAGHIRSKENS
ncbi:agmatinase family protein [Halalkalibacter sp. APA_J-10(15)]|uniref:agmatinase family protein n=1 Tax=Halalkalibacter sp. APA_J-10(15) TaxID=2933805 RepID=UPI001FF4BA03|nr:agmatinase family protein [Halalkalibacter sp. APA_J-10(15)]MCK0472364.1 agmatinase family protein [Halalkalibacter sp. APA_J-10(15)]